MTRTQRARTRNSGRRRRTANSVVSEPASRRPCVAGAAIVTATRAGTDSNATPHSAARQPRSEHQGKSGARQDGGDGAREAIRCDQRCDHGQRECQKPGVGEGGQHPRGEKHRVTGCCRADYVHCDESRQEGGQCRTGRQPTGSDCHDRCPDDHAECERRGQHSRTGNCCGEVGSDVGEQPGEHELGCSLGENGRGKQEYERWHGGFSECETGPGQVDRYTGAHRILRDRVLRVCRATGVPVARIWMPRVNSPPHRSLTRCPMPPHSHAVGCRGGHVG